jgi:hypothetical protein
MSQNNEREDIKNRIQKWLLEEGYKVQPSIQGKSLFNIVAKDSDGLVINIIQQLLKPDQIMIITRAVFSEDQQKRLQLMQKDEKNQVLWELRLELLKMDVSFSPIVLPLKFVGLSSQIYYDGLTKDNFMNRFFKVKRSLMLVFWIIGRELGESEPTTSLSYIR